MNRKNTQRAAIREYLASHPLSSTREIVDALHLEFHSTSGNLTNLYSKGEVVRERDEFGVFRYALKETKEVKEESTPTQEAPIDLGINLGADCQSLLHKDYLSIAKLYQDLYDLSARVFAFVRKSPNSSCREIADAIQEDFETVGGFLCYAFTSKRYAYKRTKDKDDTWRYCVDEDKLKVAEKSKEKKTLDDFTPREMFAHLKKLGFKWNPNALYHEEVTVKRNYVEFDKI